MKTRLVLGLAALALVAAACGGDDPATPDPANVVEDAQDAVDEAMDAADAAGSIQVSAVDNSFAPSMLAASFGEEVTYTVVNNGENPHTFTIDELSVDTGVLQSGERAELTFTMGDQDFEFYCTVHGRDVMAGTLSVAG